MTEMYPTEGAAQAAARRAALERLRENHAEEYRELYWIERRRVVVAPPGEKECVDCGETRPLYQFYSFVRKQGNTRYYQTACKYCETERRRRNKEIREAREQSRKAVRR